ncbi:MAG: hypothetical protein ABFS46_23010, partial [Myxococcota bacterium]
MAGRLKSRLPELLLEAFSVMLAVLVALAVDQWREGRANQELAASARASILDEARGNLEELRSTHADHVAMLEALASEVNELEAGADSAVIGFNLALLSAAAWQTAQVTRATQFLDFDWVRRIAQLYHLQELYDDRQAAVVDMMGTIGGEPEEAAEKLQAVGARIRIVLSLQDGLIDAYERVLADDPVSD